MGFNSGFKGLIIIMIIIMWNVKTTVIPVIIVATGTILKSFRKYVSNIPGNHEVKELTENSDTGHCAHTSESANVEMESTLELAICVP